ncbi:MAG: hypothetical protein ACFFBL_07220, partial [Promethearchaeota archaeon]
MIKKGVIITLGVVFLLSSVPFTAAQSLIYIDVGFGYDPDVGGRDYQVITSAIRVDGSLMSDGIIDNPVWNFISNPPHLTPDREEYFWYDFALSAFFEANDINKDGTFTPGIDQQVGAIVPLSHRWDSWNYSDFLFERWGEDGYLQVTHDPDLSWMQGVTALHVNYTANMTITHQHELLERGIDDWDNIPGHMRSMDIGIEIRAHFSSTTQDQFKLDYQISGWDWTYSDSILVFIMRPQIRIHEYLDPEMDYVRNFTSIKHVGNRLYFGEGYVECAQNASAGNATGQVEVNASHAVIFDPGWVPFYAHDIPVIFTAFENFGDETLEHNITLGIDSSIELPPLHRTPSAPEIGYPELLLTVS